MVTDSSTDSPTPLPNLLDAAGAAKALGLQPRAVRRMAELGELPPVALFYGARLFLAEHVAALVEKRAAPPEPKPEPPERLPRLPGARWRQKRCVRCNAIYSPDGPNAKWCGDLCREAAQAEREAAS